MRAFWTAWLLIMAAGAAQANKVTELDLHDPAPLDVEVASDDGVSYTHVTHTGNLVFRLEADCRFDKKPGFQEHDLNELEFRAYGLNSDLVSPSWPYHGPNPPQLGDFYVRTPIDTQIVMSTSFAGPVQGQLADPVQACNDELMRRVFNNPDTPREQFLAEGFEVFIDDGGALETTLWCNPVTSGGYTDFHTQHEEFDLRIRCLPSDKAAKALEPKPEPKKAHFAAFLQDLSVIVTPQNHEGECPVKHAVTGNVKVAYPGTFTYRYVDEKGAHSTTRTQKAVAAGEITLSGWYRELAPDTLGQLTTQPAEDVERKGWYRLEILSPVQTVSAPVPYSVRCVQPDRVPPARLQVPTKLPQGPTRPRQQRGGGGLASSVP
ncbi:MAG: hypothetical protein Kow0020_13000 [Wenzhouxiangellaceae bacterium]